MKPGTIIKKGLINCGISHFNIIEHVNGLLKYGHWLRNQKIKVHFAKREELYDLVNGSVGSISYDFLEFGVFKGRSIKYWVEIGTNPQNRFFGFDTFTGLPEAWDTGLGSDPIGKFNVDGKLPQIADNRVKFIKGKFQETLGDFLVDYKPQEQLIFI